MAEMAGFHFDLLDIGGGFDGHHSAKPFFEEARHSYYSCIIHFSESVRYFNKRGSKVCDAILDASKAFDSVTKWPYYETRYKFK